MKYLKKYQTEPEYQEELPELIRPNVSLVAEHRDVHYNPLIAVTGVTLNKSTLELERGNSETLVATVLPADASRKDVIWSTSDSEIATVDSDGLVTAVAAGNVTITVTTVDGGYSVQCETSVQLPLDEQYLTFVAQESGTFTFTIPSSSTTGNVTSVSYSVDNGETWVKTDNVNDQQVVITTPSVASGDTVLWKGAANVFNGSTFSSTGVFDIKGNIMSMLYGDNFAGKTSFPSLLSYIFGSMFSGCSRLINAEQLLLPATTLANNCYYYMFSNCTSLTTAPALPATTLADNCYYFMFSNCTSLATAPVLPAKHVSKECYIGMFNGCTSLTTAPELPATKLVFGCYGSMFNNCTSLSEAPELQATTLAVNCYRSMFNGCTSLTTAPALPATTMKEHCYNYMFGNCTSLTTAPELPATTLEYGCYMYMFNGCTNLNSIKCLATDISAEYCTNNWVGGIANSGTFTKASSMTGWTRGSNGIPTNWTVVDA